MASYDTTEIEAVQTLYSLTAVEAQNLLEIYANQENLTQTINSVAEIIGQGTEPVFITSIALELIHNKGDLNQTIDYLTREISWVCSTCTFENPHVMQRCEMCDTPMAVEIAMPQDFLQQITDSINLLMQPLNQTSEAWIIVTGNQFGYLNRCDCNSCLLRYYTTAQAYVAAVDPADDTNVSMGTLITQTIIPSILYRFIQRNHDIEATGALTGEALQGFIDSTLAQESKCDTASDETLDKIRCFTIDKTIHTAILETKPKCALCQSDVVDGEKVIQIPCCQQLFHPGGSDTGGSETECPGLLEYIKGHNSACPCCRKDINESFSKSD
jgi:hypothetical protein